jgi:hypothetical protein
MLVVNSKKKVDFCHSIEAIINRSNEFEGVESAAKPSDKSYKGFE